jgi:hypothetical protein
LLIKKREHVDDREVGNIAVEIAESERVELKGLGKGVEGARASLRGCER